MRLLIPIILVIAAGLLFFIYTDPKYQEVKELRAQEAEYNQALTQARELQEVRNKLISKRNTFSPDDLRKLERLLPDNVDNIRLIIDIDTIAGRYGLRIRDVSVSAPMSSREERGATAVGDAGDAVGSVELGFSVSARHEDFIRFLADLERSVRIVDVKSAAFSVGQGDLTAYSLEITTYWLR
jgi:hypothetical protein